MNFESVASIAALITALATAIGTIAAARNRKIEAKKTAADVTDTLMDSADTIVKNYKEVVETLKQQVASLQEACANFQEKFISLEKENRRTSNCVSILSEKNTRLMKINTRFIHGIKLLMEQVIALQQIPKWTPSEDDIAEVEEMNTEGEKK